jgi:hypothetical protein
MNNKVNIWHWRSDILRNNSKEDLEYYCAILCEAYDVALCEFETKTKEDVVEFLMDISMEIESRSNDSFNAFDTLRKIAKT